MKLFIDNHPLEWLAIPIGIALALFVFVFWGITLFARACWEVLAASYSKTADDPDRIIKPWS